MRVNKAAPIYGDIYSKSRELLNKRCVSKDYLFIGNDKLNRYANRGTLSLKYIDMAILWLTFSLIYDIIIPNNRRYYYGRI